MTINEIIEDLDYLLKINKNKRSIFYSTKCIECEVSKVNFALRNTRKSFRIEPYDYLKYKIVRI